MSDHNIDALMRSGFLTQASLFEPRLTSALSAWNEHIPAAGWLIDLTRPGRFIELGTHTGVSYFAFCEAVDRLGLNTECFAIDHWRGDEHSGSYGEDVFRSVQAINARYSSFSRLLRRSFDEGAEEFEEASIDLLHIDGLHTYEAVAHDYDSWLPKMSQRGVVVFHDTNERKSDFGVHKLFAELAKLHPTFEFLHGHGLGIVAIGPEVPPRLQPIVDLDPTSDETRFMREVYWSLGERFSARVEAERLQSEATRSAGEHRRLEQILRGRESEIAALKNRLERDIAQSKAAIEKRDLEISRHKELRSSEMERLAQTINELEQVRATLASRDKQIERLRASITASSKRSSDLSYALAKSQKRVFDLETSTAWKTTKPLRYAADVVKRLGRKVKRTKVTPTPASTQSRVDRLYTSFDDGLDAATRDELRAHLTDNPHLRDTLISVVLPTRDRAAVIPLAIKSVQCQVHEQWELLVIDDGSTDDTETVIGGFSDDERIRYINTDPHGVGAARNAGLALARGDVIAYLDSDNAWDPEFLSLTIAGMDRDGADVAYSAVRMVRDDEVVGYRGDFFDYKACLKGNYIDINALCHRREPLDQGLVFEPRIRRTNDWDMILGLTYGREVSYLPFVGVTYSLDRGDDRISLVEPFVFRHIVEARHRARLGTDSPLETFEDVVGRLSLSIAIRIAAPSDKRDLWGDHHFAVGVVQALERLGHQATVYYREDEVQPRRHDVVIVLRGLDRFEPVPEAINLLWSISHPDLVDHEEMRGYDIVCVASESYRRMLSYTLGKQVSAVRQATDRARFYPHPPSVHDGSLLFVGNSRNVNRPTVRMAIEAGLPLAIYGSGWDGIAPQEAIQSPYLPNKSATYAYAGAAAVLNDHWESMKDFGYISNRVYDALASGAHLISDYFPELEREFGDVVVLCRDQDDFVEAAKAALNSGSNRNDAKTALEIIDEHSFDARAVSLLGEIRRFLGAEEPIRGSNRSLAKTAVDRSRKPRVRIGILPQMPDGMNWSSSAYIRLLLPLTSDLEGEIPEVTIVQPGQMSESSAVDKLDCLIVSRTAVKTLSEAEKLVGMLEHLGTPLVVDTDDAFHLIDQSHPQYDEYRPHIEALDALMENAAEIWCSTGSLKEAIDARFGLDSVLVGNSIDPRLWRRYRNREPMLRVKDRLEMLYFGTATHGPELAMILPALDEQASANPDKFRLSVVGVTRELPDRPWIQRIVPPNPSTYPDFSRWMRDLSGEFDVAIAPLVDTPFNRLKSDIKVLEYTAMGLPAVVSSLGPYQDLDWADRCSSLDDWGRILDELIGDRSAVEERRAHVAAREGDMWRERRAAVTGEVLMGRISSIVQGRATSR